jgi:hypothetical protein
VEMNQMRKGFPSLKRGCESGCAVRPETVLKDWRPVGRNDADPGNGIFSRLKKQRVYFIEIKDGVMSLEVLKLLEASRPDRGYLQNCRIRTSKL